MSVLAKAAKIKLLSLDVDGVMTDGSLLLDDNGMQYKTFNVKDGLGIKMLQSSGVEIAIITGKTSKVVEHRATELGIQYVYQGQKDKTAAYAELKKKLSLSDEQCAHIGDDLPDLSIMLLCGLSIAVNDASPAVKDEADWTTNRNGGQGAIREACELIMQAQRTWEATLNSFISAAK